MATEFDKINDLAGWRAKLDELLDNARRVAINDDLDPRLSVADRLTEFIIKSPAASRDNPASLEYDEMDRTAKAAHDNLLLATAQQRVAALMVHSAEIALIRKNVENRAQANLQAAAALRLEKARKVADSTTAYIATIMDLKKEIMTSPQKADDRNKWLALTTELDAVMERVQLLRDEMEKIA